MTCASCGLPRTGDAAWCPRCYLPYARAEAGAPTLPPLPPPPPGGGTAVATQVRGHRLSHRMSPPAPIRMSWPVRGFVLALAVVVGGVLWVGIPRGLSCRTSALHPHSQRVSEIVSKDQKVVQRLATGPTKGWTVDDGKAVLAADATMRSALTPLALSKDDRAAVSAYLATVARFDQALSAYIDRDDDESHQAYSAAAGDLQKDAETLSAALASTPQRCHLS